MLRLRHPFLHLLIFLLILLGVVRSFTPPDPRPADSPDVLFSADRAYAILAGLLEEGVPHVSGSPENRVIRDRIVSQLREYGYEPEVQSRFHCNAAFGTCSPVENILAVKPGSGSGRAVLLTSHYDSSWTGPGAADAGSGVAAVLEIARMAADYPPYQNDIVFLITDSEENGLIGADAFARHHPLFESVRVVINLEARGVTGPSAMFETGDGNRRIIREMSQTLDRPVANSLAYEIYKRMPNDTDYSVYKGFGVMGLNFAFSNGVAAYHSVVDDLENLDLGSLQHHGDNAWDMLNALGDRPLSGITAEEDAGYIDVFGNRLLQYPESVALGLSLFLVVAMLFGFMLTYRGGFRFRDTSWAFLAIPCSVLLTIVFAYLLSFPLGVWADIHPIEHPAPWFGRIALFTSTLLAMVLTLRIFGDRVSPRGLLLLGWVLFAILAMVLAVQLPTAVHLFLIPIVLFIIGSLLDAFRRRSGPSLQAAAALGFAGATFIALSHFFMLDVVLNFQHSYIKILPLVLIVIAAMPLLARHLLGPISKWWLYLPMLLIIATTVAQLLQPGFTPERPRSMNIIYSEVAGDAEANLILESPYRLADMDFAERAGFAEMEVDVGRDEPATLHAIRIPRERLPDLRMTMQSFQADGESGQRRFAIEVPDGVRRLQFRFGEDSPVQQARVNGVLALDTSIETKRNTKINQLRIVYPEPGELGVELIVDSREPLEFSAVAWYPSPEELIAPYREGWPDDAQPLFFPPRAQKIQRFELLAGQSADDES